MEEEENTSIPGWKPAFLWTEFDFARDPDVWHWRHSVETGRPLAIDVAARLIERGFIVEN